MNNYTDYIDLTELWNDGSFTKVGEIINNESWSPNRVANFCAYFIKYVGLRDLEVLCKLI